MDKINKSHVVIFIDWDDTIFPSSWYNNIKLGNVNFEKILKDYDKKLILFITKLNLLGNVFIVTNATKSWINKTLLLVPQSKQFILKNIFTISARDKYSRKYPEKPDIWKFSCFQKILYLLEKEKKVSPSRIISIGDSEYEKNALIKIYRHGSMKKIPYFKTIQLNQVPEIEELYAQITILHDKIEDIICQNNHNDLFYCSK